MDPSSMESDVTTVYFVENASQSEDDAQQAETVQSEQFSHQDLINGLFQLSSSLVGESDNLDELLEEIEGIKKSHKILLEDNEAIKESQYRITLALKRSRELLETTQTSIQDLVKSNEKLKDELMNSKTETNKSDRVEMIRLKEHCRIMTDTVNSFQRRFDDLEREVYDSEKRIDERMTRTLLYVIFILAVAMFM